MPAGRWWREPLLHFACLGLALLAAERWVTGSDDAHTIVVSRDAIAGFRQDHLRRTGREPDAAEEEMLIERYLDDEIRYREGLALGLDRGDIIVRRRIVQKMEFLTENTDPIPEPSDAELQAYLDARAGEYRVPERISFTHVFASNERNGSGAKQVAGQLGMRLAANADPALLGEPFLRGRELKAKSRPEVAAIFGPGFADAVFALAGDAWSEPIESSFGFHLVKVERRIPSHVPGLGEVRDRLRNDWRAERREDLDRRALARLRAQYRVRVER